MELRGRSPTSICIGRGDVPYILCYKIYLMQRIFKITISCMCSPVLLKYLKLSTED